MDSISTLVSQGSARLTAREEAFSNNPEIKAQNRTMLDLTIALMVLIVIATSLVGSLFFLRRVRRRNALARETLPTHNDPAQQGHKRLTITTTSAPAYTRNSAIVAYDEKSPMMSDSGSPSSPVPEIRITFPDEQDDAGRKTSGRVVVVRVGETSVGLEPLPQQDEQLPAYQKESGERFDSIDMDRIGGLKEKHEKDQFS
ncbi:hypothetical protein HYALB_00000844 [Hymenoscyphus albidus]|uniref:Uncharacterized protein n=1 Tax=Hymenoscyphus albidus TaxID=595503 RepID=A0A9N9L989_9HELO|nr:hypothetical protein HYALB_00000844 [Hymenoscyphus albidus]